MLRNFSAGRNLPMKARFAKASKIFDACYVRIERKGHIEKLAFEARPSRRLTRRASADDAQHIVPQPANLPPHRRFSVSGAPLMNPGQQAPTRAQILEQLGMDGLLALDTNTNDDAVAANIELADNEMTIEGVSIFLKTKFKLVKLVKCFLL